jgi:hypothetical protein
MIQKYGMCLMERCIESKNMRTLLHIAKEISVVEDNTAFQIWTSAPYTKEATMALTFLLTHCVIDVPELLKRGCEFWCVGRGNRYHPDMLIDECKIRILQLVNHCSLDGNSLAKLVGDVAAAYLLFQNKSMATKTRSKKEKRALKKAM